MLITEFTLVNVNVYFRRVNHCQQGIQLGTVRQPSVSRKPDWVAAAVVMVPKCPRVGSEVPVGVPDCTTGVQKLDTGDDYQLMLQRVRLLSRLRYDILIVLCGASIKHLNIC